MVEDSRCYGHIHSRHHALNDGHALIKDEKKVLHALRLQEAGKLSCPMVATHLQEKGHESQL